MPFTPRTRVLLWAITAFVVSAGGTFLWKWANRPWRPTNPDVLQPKAALAALKGPTTYCNQAARISMVGDLAKLLPEPARDMQSLFSRGMAQAVQDPRLFRELDRQSRFDEVWLVGDPSSYKPLVEHLLETRDFTLGFIDHTSLIFRRGGESWSQAQIDSLGAKFPENRDRAYALALTAAKLIAVRQTEPAAKLLREAEAASTQVPEVWAGWSTYQMVQGRWDKALEAADRALAIDPESATGIACRAQCLYATKRFGEAWNEGERLLAKRPDDPAMLFYHAKLAHEARAFQAEIASLRKLIGIAERAKANVSGYRVYLAQAYAATNDADGALDEVTQALLDTTLPKEQRQFADELLAQIKRAMTQEPQK